MVLARSLAELILTIRPEALKSASRESPLAEGEMDQSFNCPHCGGNAFQVLKHDPDTVECLGCGRTYSNAELLKHRTSGRAAAHLPGGSP
jgi:hypothetical protein